MTTSKTSQATVTDASAKYAQQLYQWFCTAFGKPVVSARADGIDPQGAKDAFDYQIRYRNDKSRSSYVGAPASYYAWKGTVSAALTDWSAIFDPKEDDQKTKPPHMDKSTPLAALVSFVCPVPSGSQQVPDYPKVSIMPMIKGTLDAITDAKLWGDDSQVVALAAVQRWARPGETHGIRVAVWHLV